MRRKRLSRVRLKRITRSRYGTRPNRQFSEIGGGQPPQSDDHIDRRDDLAAGENRGDRAL
jgi:hypothetical protein